jgi:hypothetical protein
MIALLLLAGALGFAAQPEPSVPLFFIPNAGQTDASIRYMVQAPDLRAGFGRDSAIFQIQGTQVRVRFAGANRDAEIQGADPLRGRASFLLGDKPEQWRSGLQTFRKILYRDLYPGIDMTYGGAGYRIKSEYIVAPNADPRQIRLEYSNADRVSIGSDGELVVQVGGVELREEAPVVYQESASVRASYRLFGRNTVGFEIGDYDVSRLLIIDPVISYSTYLGGTAMSAVTGLATDGDGNLYITGWTEALDFPIADAVQAINKGGVDAFVVKLNPTGDTLLNATYIGGKGDDRATAIAVDSSNSAIVVGSTASANFPLVAPIRSILGGGRDAFALKLTADGSQMVFSTLLGGSDYDAATAVAVDNSGDIYVAGDTRSADFPVLQAAQPALSGKMDAFVTKLSTRGAILYSTFLGGTSDEHAGGIAVDLTGNAYVAGGTTSQDFPLVVPIQAANGGSQDAFVTKISAAGSQLLYSTYLGGSGGAAGTPEQANAIAVDALANAYVAGVTNSPNFPVTAGALETSYRGGQDAFLAKIASGGSSLVYCTYLGGSSFDWASGIALDSGGNAYVAGYTSSLDFPIVNGVQAGFNGLYDAFVSEVNAAGNGLTFSTMFGGTGGDQANAIALDANRNMFIGGQTNSLDFPLQGPIQQNNLGGSTGWVARLGVTPPPAQVPSTVSVTPSSGSGNAVTFTAVYSHPAGAAAITAAALLVNDSISPNLACFVSFKAGLNQIILADDIATTSGGVNSQCTLNGSGSGAVLSGTTLTLTVSLIFEQAFTGNKTVYLSASDANVTTGWVARGTWNVTIPPAQPTADSVSPGIGSGASQVFTFVFSDSQSATNVTGMAVLFNTSVSFPNACYIVYDRNAGTVALLYDSAAGSSSKSLSSTAVLQNSQCAVGAASATIAGLSNTLMVSITFKGSFSGPKNIYMYAAEPILNTGWVQRGTYTVAAGGAPVALSVVPGAGFGPGERFSFTISDLGGSTFITGVAALFASSFNNVNACSLVYDRTANTVSLGYDNPANGATPVIPGSGAIASNSQCTLNAANTTVVIGINSVVLTLDLTFNAAFFGPKNIYLYGAEPGVNSGWVTVGGWTVTGGAPTADSVTPSSGSGAFPSFTFTVSDSSSQANITGIDMLFTAGSPSNIVNSCDLVYDRNAETIGLFSDDVSILNTKGIGSSATLENNQCAVGYTVMTTSGNSVSFTINMFFKSAAFTGSKGTYIQAVEPNTSSGWVSRGVWTVP